MIIGIDHGYYAIKTKQVCFPTGLMRYTYEPYTMQNVLQYGGAYYVCGTGRQTLVKDKTANDNYYLLTLAALAQEIRKRKGERTAKVVLAAGLPLTAFSRFPLQNHAVPRRNSFRYEALGQSNKRYPRHRSSAHHSLRKFPLSCYKW